MAPKLLVIVASTRPGRVGRAFGDWMIDFARANSDYDVEMADLKELDLPLMDEPNHPRMQQYTHEHTKRWSAMVDAADAFVIVMPEYNYSFNAALKNALDYLFNEWRDKPVGFLSYGGISGGVRAVQQLKPVISLLSMPTPVNAIAVPFAPKYLDDQGQAHLSDEMADSGRQMLDEMKQLGERLRPQK